MARARGFEGPPWEAGRAVNALEDLEHVNPALLPVDTRHPGLFRYLVSVGYRSLSNPGEVVYSTVEVLTSQAYFPLQIRELAIQESFGVFHNSNVGGRKSGRYDVDPSEVTILYATRGG